MQSRDESLEELVRKTAEFGLELFSQPTSWSVQWKDSDAQLGPLDEDERLGVLGQIGSHHRNFVVFPGLEKIAVDHATGTFQRTPVKVLGAEIDRNIEIGSSYRVSSIQIGLASWVGMILIEVFDKNNDNFGKAWHGKIRKVYPIFSSNRPAEEHLQALFP